MRPDTELQPPMPATPRRNRPGNASDPRHRSQPSSEAVRGSSIEVDVSAPRPDVDAAAGEALDAIPFPLTVAAAVRDRDARLLDFRLAFVNAAAASWAGLPAASMQGRLVTDLLPGLRPAGLYDALAEVVARGRPFRRHRQPYEGNVEEGNAFAGIFDLVAVRLGDGYLSIWTELPDGGVTVDLDAAARAAIAVIPMVRHESHALSRPRLRPAT